MEDKIFEGKRVFFFVQDVAARGLDLPKVDCVIQYTGPTSARDYVHRIGRTARAGSSGSATILLTPPEIEFVRMLESRRIRIRQESMDDVLDRLMGPLSKHSSAHNAAVALQNDFENLILEDTKLRERACKGKKRDNGENLTGIISTWRDSKMFMKFGQRTRELSRFSWIGTKARWL